MRLDSPWPLPRPGAGAETSRPDGGRGFRLRRQDGEERHLRNEGRAWSSHRRPSLLAGESRLLRQSPRWSPPGRRRAIFLPEFRLACGFTPVVIVLDFFGIV